MAEKETETAPAGAPEPVPETAKTAKGGKAAKGAAERAEAVEGRQFDDAEARQKGPEQNLEVVLDIPITLSMELGRSRLSIRELLQLAQGSVVKLDRPAGEPLDILVNGCLVARGEVVVVNERFGLRVTDILSPEDRIKRLR